MKTILLTGCDGQVGWELQRTLMPLGRVAALDMARLDLADPDAIRSAVREIRPDIIVNAAAYTAVDRAESEPGLAMAVNGQAPAVLAEESKRLGAWMVHYSTDYVFDGEKQGAYLESDSPNPRNVYGKTKLAGEEAVQALGGKYLILRTSWVYGARGHNFMLTMLRLARERSELRVVDDQVGAPTWCRSLAEITAQMLAQIHAREAACQNGESLAGLYHLTSAGSVSWHGFARRIFELSATSPSPNLVAIPSSEFPTPACRPGNSQLSNEKLDRSFGLNAGAWQDGLKLCLEEMRG